MTASSEPVACRPTVGTTCSWLRDTRPQYLGVAVLPDALHGLAEAVEETFLHLLTTGRLEAKHKH